MTKTSAAKLAAAAEHATDFQIENIRQRQQSYESGISMPTMVSGRYHPSLVKSFAAGTTVFSHFQPSMPFPTNMLGLLASFAVVTGMG